MKLLHKLMQVLKKFGINADKIDIDGKAVRFSTEITQSFGPYTQQDAERIKKIIMGTITPTSADYEKYDIDGNKKIDISDWLRVAKAVQSGNGYFTEKGTFMIDPYSAQKSIKIYRNDNNTNIPTAILSVITNYFNEINIGRTIDFIEDEDGISTYINSRGINLSSETNGPNASFGIMTVNGEDGGHFSIGNSYGDVYGYIDTDDGGTIILDRYGFVQTIVKATGITTPSLTQTSREESKKNFEKLENGLDILKQVDIYRYNLKSEEDTKKKHKGFVIGDSYKYSHEITAEDENGKEIGVDIYSMVSVLWKAVQELNEKVEKQDKLIKILLEKLNIGEVNTNA